MSPSLRLPSAVLCFAVLGLILCPPTPAGASPGSGAFVVRFQDQIGFFIVDDAAGLMSFHGTDLTFAQICSGGPFAFEDLDIQLVISPTGPLHALFTSPEHHVVIYPTATLPDPHHVGPGDCPILATLPVLASGTARLVRTDNDLTFSGNGANAYGWTSNGTLLQAGTSKALTYSETVRGVILPGTSDPRDLKASIRLAP